MSKINVKVLDSVTRIEYNGDTYHVKARDEVAKPEAGDIIRMNNGDGVVKSGEYYVVDCVRPDGDPEIVLDGGDRCDAGYYDYDVYRKEPAEYREVKRKARVGERIKIVNPFITGGQYGKGDTLTVTKVANNGVSVEEFGMFVCHPEYVVLEQVASPTFEKGEKVRLISGGGRLPLLGYENGEIYEVVGKSDSGKTVINGGKGGYGTGFARPEQLEKVDVAERKYRPGDRVRTYWSGDIYTLTKRRPEFDGEKYGTAWNTLEGGWIGEKQFELVEDSVPNLAPGDYVKVVKNIDGDEEFNVGDIRKVTVIDADDDETPYATRNLDGSDFMWHYAAELVKATDEEVDKAKLEAKEAAKWSAIGRKPGEYKKGDIVEVTEGCGAIKRGDIAEITEADGSAIPGVSARGEEWYCSVKLITPVEQRFDRK